MMLNAGLMKEHSFQWNVRTRHLWHFNLSLHNLLYAGLSIRYLSLTIIICPLLVCCICTVAFKEHRKMTPTEQCWHSDCASADATLQRCYWLNGALTAEIKSTAVTDGMSSQAVTKSKGGFHLRGCCANINCTVSCSDNNNEGRDVKYTQNKS